jgi:hypothetical protein
MSNQPVYRRPRSHAYSCRCPRCAPRGDFVARNGILGPGFAILCVVAVIGFWPAMVWHGYTDTGGWRWDIHSTAAELAYAGVIAFIALLYWADHRTPGVAGRTAREVPPSGPLMSSLPAVAAVIAAPACRHPDAIAVDSLLGGEPWAWLCAAETGGCGAQLPAEFGRLARPCCGSAPGTPHQYNCPEG